MAGSAAGGGVDRPIDPDRDALLAVLIRHGVAFVLIGGAAIQSHGGAYDTQDIDLAPEVGAANLQSLCAALNELECRLVTDPANTEAWVMLPDDYFTPRSVRGASVWNLATRYGQLDLTFAPSAFPTGYAELSKRADRRQVAGTSAIVLVAALEDVHRSKRPLTDRRTRPTSGPWPTPDHFRAVAGVELAGDRKLLVRSLTTASLRQPHLLLQFVVIWRCTLPSQACVGLH